MTYSELKSLIQNYLQNTETTFVSDLPNLIKQAEERILKTVNLPVFKKNVSGTLTTGNQYLSTPSDFLDNFSLSYTDTRCKLYKRSISKCYYYRNTKTLCFI